MIDWYKKQVEKTLENWGLSNYQAHRISFLKGLVIGGVIVHYFI